MQLCIIHILLIFGLLMHICHACGASFQKSQGLRNHQKRWCKEADFANRTAREVQRIAIPNFTKPKLPRNKDVRDVERKRQKLRDQLHEETDVEPIANAPEVLDPVVAGPSNHIHSPSPLPDVRTRTGRKRKFPKAFRDLEPSDYRAFSKMHDLAQLIPPPPPPPIIPPSIASSPLARASPSVDSSTVDHEVGPSVANNETTPHYITGLNPFNLYRIFTKAPQRDPAAMTTTDMLVDSSTIATPSQAEGLKNSNPLRVFGSKLRGKVGEWFAPLSSASSALLMRWQYSGGGKKSEGELQRLINTVIMDDNFKKSELADFSVKTELKHLDEYDTPAGIFSEQDGWKSGSVKIHLPKEDTMYDSENDAPEFEIQGIWYRPLISVIKSAYEDVTQKHFHNIPFKLFHRLSDHKAGDPLTDDSERVWTDIYNSDALLEEQAKVDALPRNPEDDESVEYTVAPIMGYSDSTHLTSFGTASLWPIYTWMAALSKYIRSKPSNFTAHHTAYIPKLPSSIQDFYHKVYGTAATPNVLRLCRSELLQKIWTLLLDADFMHAYEHGIVVLCGDGIRRRLFPRFLTYSADYPERVALTCLRFLGNCPCPTCLIEKKNIALMGSKRDSINSRKARVDDKNTQDTITRARSWIFEKGIGLKSAWIERALGSLSLLPIRSTFSERLAEFGFNFYSMFTPDVLHEVELGTFKSVFAMILRVLFAFDPDNLTKLNSRFRRVPTFGRNTIRKFVANVSSRSNFSAHDYENVLKVAIPAVEGLLPERLNIMVLNVLWAFALWHALAKLRVQTDSTLTALETATTLLGTETRKFAKECRKHDIRELPAEESARHRRKRREQEKKMNMANQPQTRTQSSKESGNSGKGKQRDSDNGPKQKQLNLQTFKWHNLRHYVGAIRRFGPTDGYSTQIGELEHRRVKRFYDRTSRKGYAQQIGRHVRREKIVHSIFEREAARRQRIANETQINRNPGTHPQPTNSKSQKQGRPTKTKPAVGFCDNDPLTAAPFRDHYQISDSTRLHHDLTSWVIEHANDPAVQDFVPLLKNHLIARLMNKAYSGDEQCYSDKQHLSLQLENNVFYRHKTLRINYTTYDMRRDQDCINPRNHADVMVLAHEDDEELDPHPYWYARVLGIFHANVKYLGEGSLSREFKRVDFLWIRWFGRDPDAPGGFAARRLHRVGFVDAESGGAFGFLDPSLIIRAAHLIPAFHYGRTSALLKGPSIARQYDADPDDVDCDEDWQYYYVNIFADRDMFMRYLGGGLGHKAFRALIKIQDALAALGAISKKEDDLEAMSSDGNNEWQADESDEDIEDDTDIDDEQAEDPDQAGGNEEDSADGAGIDLGPEDGEGGSDEEDEYATLGFAPF